MTLKPRFDRFEKILLIAISICLAIMAIETARDILIHKSSETDDIFFYDVIVGMGLAVVVSIHRETRLLKAKGVYA